MIQWLEHFAVHLLKIGCTLCVVGFLVIVVALMLHVVADVLN